MLWSTQTNAFSRSQNIPPIGSLSFKAFKVLFSNLNLALSVEECDLKPNSSFGDV